LKTGELLHSANRPFVRQTQNHMLSDRMAAPAPVCGRSGDILCWELHKHDPAKVETVVVPITNEEYSALGKEQQAAFVAIVQLRKSVFLTGKAGSGKSFLLKLIRRCFPLDEIYFTGSTGLAAVSLLGTTLHSFAGIGLGEGTVEQLLDMVRRKSDVVQRWQQCRILVVDEISMISGELLDKIDAVARGVRGSSEPFGGIQLVLTGDLLQISPVKGKVPILQSSAWKSNIKLEVLMGGSYRHEDDPTFADILDEMRVGKMNAKAKTTLAATGNRELVPLFGVRPTQLYPRRDDADDANTLALSELLVPPVTFQALNWKRGPMHHVLEKNCPAADRIVLKRGAQVMLLKNLDTSRGLCNGSRGTVYDFVQRISRKHRLTEKDLLLSEAEQARMVEVGMDLGIGPMPLHSPYIPGDRKRLGLADSEEHAGHCDGIRAMLLPRILFENGKLEVIDLARFDISQGKRTLALRCQLPLALAWATSIHKAQGMTLEQVEIDAERMFEEGQLYVALSRVKKLSGLKLTNLTSGALRCNKAMVVYYEELRLCATNMIPDLLRQQALIFGGPVPPTVESDDSRGPSSAASLVDFVNDDSNDEDSSMC
jgi:ATP-dependent DNA helicase PIF1